MQVLGDKFCISCYHNDFTYRYKGKFDLRLHLQLSCELKYKKYLWVKSLINLARIIHGSQNQELH